MKSVVFIANENNKLFNVIREKKSQDIDDGQIKEIEVLKSKCLSSNVQECLLSCQTFVTLIEDGVLGGPFVLALFMSILPSASPDQYTAITEGIVELLLQDLKRRNYSSTEKYICRFGLRPPQHPFIMLIQKDEKNMNNLSNKINWICNHYDKEIKSNSIEFLRSVYLYMFCNPSVLPDCRTIWTNLLKLTNTSNDALSLSTNILSWLRFNSSSNCILNSLLITEAIEQFSEKDDKTVLIELVIYLSSIIKNLCEYGYDPRPSINLILKTLYQLDDSYNSYQNILLVILGQTLHVISPIYFIDLIRILKVIIIDKNYCSVIPLYTILDAMLQWIAHPSFVSSNFITDIKILIDYIIHEKYKSQKRKTNTKLFISSVKYYNSDIALAYDLCVLCEKWEDADDSLIIKNFISNLKDSKSGFLMKQNLILRALFLSSKLDHGDWKIVFELLLGLVMKNEYLASVFLMPYLYRLASETNPELNLILLNGITAFGAVKENVPILLNTIKALSEKHMMSFYLNLHLKLWQVEPRTYSFLHKILLEPVKDNSWEVQIVRANTIKEICKVNAALHGKDLVSILSGLLNSCTDKYGEIATSLAIESISILCENNVINVVSTWNALSGKFKNEKRPKVIKRLCQFFGLIPKLRNPTHEYEVLTIEALEKLWNYVTNFNDAEIIAAGLDGLKNYNFSEMQLKHIPEVFRQNIALPSSYIKTPIDATKSPLEVLAYIPGECWLQLIQNINHLALDEAGDLVGHVIHKEIQEYRGGVYLLPEGRQEPKDLKSLPAKSPLRAIVSYVIQQSQISNRQNEYVLHQCLRILSNKFPKPIPPLNWCFLHEFFHDSFEFRKYCLKISVHQSIHSGTAKRVIENYLSEFNPYKANIIDNNSLLDMLPDLCRSIDEHIFLLFLTKCFAFMFEKKSNEENENVIERTLENIKIIFNENVKNENNKSTIIELMIKYFDIIELESKFFSKFGETLCTLPSDSVDGLTSPNAWWEIDPIKLKKSTHIRCMLLKKNNKSFENPLNWINPIIDAFAKLKGEQSFLFKYLSKALREFNDSKNACIWILELLGQIQALLANENLSAVDSDKCSYLCDVFVISIIMLSGCYVFSTKIDDFSTSRQNRLNVFPQSIYLLCQTKEWADNTTKIFEFLYHMYLNATIPQYFKKAFKLALINSKHHKYFQQKDYWTKYVSLRDTL